MGSGAANWAASSTVSRSRSTWSTALSARYALCGSSQSNSSIRSLSQPRVFSRVLLKISTSIVSMVSPLLGLPRSAAPRLQAHGRFSLLSAPRLSPALFSLLRLCRSLLAPFTLTLLFHLRQDYVQNSVAKFGFNLVLVYGFREHQPPHKITPAALLVMKRLVAIALFHGAPAL